MKKIFLGVMGFAMAAEAAVLTSASYIDSEVVHLSTNGVPVMSKWTLPEGTVVHMEVQGDQEFLRWIGDVPADVDATSRAIDVTLGTTDLQIMPLFRGMWVVKDLASGSFDSFQNVRTGVIECTSNPWKIRSFVSNESERYLRIGIETRKNILAGEEGEMDLSQPVVDESGNLWKIISFNGQALNVDENPKMKSLILPKTLTSFGGQFLHYGQSVLTNLVMDCPNLKGELSGWNFYNINGNNLKGLTIKLPGATAISGIAFGWQFFPDAIDVSDWDFSSVATMSEYSGSRYVFNGMKFKGTLRLQRVKTLCANNFNNTVNLDAIELGTCGNTLKTVGAKAFAGTCGIKRLALGGAAGWTIPAGAVVFSNNLTQVEFLGAPPVVTDGTFAEETDKSAMSVCFYVPEDNLADWSDIMNHVVRETTAEDLTAWNANPANASARPPRYVLAKEAFGTKYDQLLGFTRVATVKITARTADERFGGSVTITPERPQGFYFADEEITITANPAAGTTFTRWTDLPRGVTNFYDSTLTFKVGKGNRDILMWAGPDWTYLPEENLITNKVWKIRASATTGTGNLKIGNGDTYGAYTGYGEGVLDLSGKVYEAGNPNSEWVITELSSNCFHTRPKKENNNKWIDIVTHLVIPRTTLRWYGQFLNANAGTSVMETIILDAPDCTSSLNGYTLNGRWGATRVCINLPLLTTINVTDICGAGTFTDIDTWNLSGLTTIQKNAISMSGREADMVFNLPAIKSIDDNGIGTKQEALSFGTGYDIKDKAVLTLKNGAFKTMKQVKRWELGAYDQVILGDGVVFENFTALRELVCEGKPLGTEFLDAALSCLPALADQTEPMVIYGSALLGWNHIPGLASLDVLTTEERAKADSIEGNIIGVYVSGDDKKAFVVHRKSRFDPDGTVLIIR